MEFRELGKTHESVPVVGMGTWKMGTGSQEELTNQLHALRRGLDLGMTLIDTAEIYGNGKAEELVANAIKGKRESIFVATKVWSEHLHYDDVIRACRGSLERLGTAYVDLYQVHWPNPQVPVRETMRAMERLVAQGKTRYIGVSNFNVKQLQDAQDSLAKVELASNQVEYSLLSRSAEREVIPYCEKQKITVIAYSPLARGRIPGSKIPAILLKRYSMTAAQIMLNWVTANKQVIAIPKASRVDHVEENAKSVQIRLESDDFSLLSRLFV